LNGPVHAGQRPGDGAEVQDIDEARKIKESERAGEHGDGPLATPDDPEPIYLCVPTSGAPWTTNSNVHIPA
jgi:hypothetical protein